jgi:predicted GNAT family acetyltransferase
MLVSWFQSFQADVGDAVTDGTEVVRRRLAAGHLWIWEDDAPVAMTGLFAEVCNVVRVGPVYTPPDRRNHGYASSLVAALSRVVLERGQRCILYTDLENPTSNAIYRAIGYRAVAEALRYRFGDSP